MENPIKTTNTTLSVGTSIQNATIAKAKDYLSINYKKKYNLNPHFNFIIMAMPESSLDRVKTLLDNFFKNKEPLRLHLSTLRYEDQDKFFSIPIVGYEIMEVHKQLLTMLNETREGYIRVKDAEKMALSKRKPEEVRNIKLYGYPRMLQEFTPHITIGNIGTEKFNLIEVTKKLNSILNDIYGKTIEIDEVGISFYKEAEIQTDLKFLWTTDYKLNERAGK